MDHKVFLQRFETTAEAASAFDVTQQAIRHWRLTGIPPRHWIKAEQISKRRRWKVTAAMLAETHPSASRKVA